MKHLARLLVGSLLALIIATILVGPSNLVFLVQLFVVCIPFSLGLVNVLMLAVAYFLGYMLLEIYAGMRPSRAQPPA